MQIGFVILGIAAVFLLIIGAFCGRKYMEKRRRTQPTKAEPVQKKTMPAKRATMNISGLSADGPSMPSNGPMCAEAHPAANTQQTTINLAMLQSRPQETPVVQPNVVQPNVVQPEPAQPMMPAGQMPFMYPPYMMGMPPASGAATPQMGTPQMAHMPAGYPMGFAPPQMWQAYMGQMMANYPPNTTSVSMPVSPTQSAAPAIQSTSNRRNRNRNQSIIQPSGNYRRESFMPPEHSDTHRPRQRSDSNDDDPPPPSYSMVCPSNSRR